MKVIYDATADVLRIVFREGSVEDFNEDMPNVKIDYDTEDKLIALEISQASHIVDDPRLLEHQVLEN